MLGRVHHAARPLGPAHRRRGSILILVLALLSILLILATTLSYTSRLELAATANFARGVQGRFAALSALPVAAAVFGEAPEVTHLLEPWARGDGASGSGANLSLNQANPGVIEASTLPIGSQSATLVSSIQGRGANDQDPLSSAVTTVAAEGSPRREEDPLPSERSPGQGMSHWVIGDESARLNINVATARPFGTQEIVADSAAMIDLTAFVEAALSDAGLDPAPAPDVARAITLWRHGADSHPGISEIDDDLDSRRAQPLTNGRDDDGDGRVDEEDEEQLAMRFNGLDDNADGEIDDSDEGLETDGRDNDGDGVLDEIGEGLDEPDEAQADPRLATRGDDRHFERVEDLRQVPMVTQEIYDALAPHVTVHSASQTLAPDPERDESGGGAPHLDPLVDVNRASYPEIRAQLAEHFPSAPDQLLTLIALRIVDARDTDRIPSTAPSRESSSRPLLGLEQTPLIVEVWPDSESDSADGDDGQYVEIYNPWPQPYDLSDCELRVHGFATSLLGMIPPQGRLIVTDDYDETDDEDPEDDSEGYGSFYEIFELVPNGSSQMLIVNESFDLPDVASTITLHDAEGNMLDHFTWRLPSTEAGMRLSFQRNDPRVRETELRLCSPWELNRNHEPTELFADTHRDTAPRDQPFATPADLMFVFAGWEGAVDPERRGWYFPEIHSADPGAIDSRLVDIFSVGLLEPMEGGEEDGEVALSADTAIASDADDPDDVDLDAAAATDPAEEEEEAKPLWATTGREWALGRINVNTATRPVLAALPGMDEALVNALLNWRAQVELMWIQDPTVIEPPFTCRGDLLRNEFLWQGRSLRERLLRYRQFVNAVTTSSAVCRVEATAANVPGRRTPTTVPRALEATLELRDGEANLVSLDFIEDLR